MNTSKKTAHKAGFLYLLIAIVYSFSMIYVDSAIYVPGNVEATMTNLSNSKQLFILGLFSCLAGHVIFILLANTLYTLFVPYNKILSKLMVIFVFLGVSISFLNRLNHLAAFNLATNPFYANFFNMNELEGLTMFFFDLQQHGGKFATIFWALWLLPLGLLIIKSRMIPRLLGILLISTCIAYLADIYFFYAFNGYHPQLISLIAIVSEVSFLLWLLIKGVKTPKHKLQGS